MNARKSHEPRKEAATNSPQNGVAIGSEYADRITDDDDARASYRVIMAEQGCKVKSVTIGNPCLVEIEG